jgi:hypothetical protein
MGQGSNSLLQLSGIEGDTEQIKGIFAKLSGHER